MHTGIDLLDVAVGLAALAVVVVLAGALVLIGTLVDPILALLVGLGGLIFAPFIGGAIRGARGPG